MILNILLYKNHYVLNILTRITTILLTVFTIKQLPVIEISQLLYFISILFKLRRSVSKIASFEFGNLKYFNSTFMNLKKMLG